MVSDSLDTSILEADGFREAVPVLLYDIQHFVTFRNLKLVANGCCHREPFHSIYDIFCERNTTGVGWGDLVKKIAEEKICF